MDALHFSTPIPKSRRFIAQKHFVELCGGHPGIILSDINPVYLNALVPERFVAAPIDGKHDYPFSNIWHYNRPEALALVKRGLDQALPVYTLFVSRKEMDEKAPRLPELDGYEWVAVENHVPDAVVLRLVPISQ